MKTGGVCERSVVVFDLELMHCMISSWPWGDGRARDEKSRGFRKGKGGRADPTRRREIERVLDRATSAQVAQRKAEPKRVRNLLQKDSDSPSAEVTSVHRKSKKV